MLLPRAITQIVDKIARQAVGKDWGLYATMLERWTEIVGAEYAADTSPVKISFPHQPLEQRCRAGTLTIRLPKGLAMEFTFKNDIIRQRINTYFGYDVISKIAFDPVFATRGKAKKIPPPINQAALNVVRTSTESVDNDELRGALQSFGEAIVGSKGR